MSENHQKYLAFSVMAFCAVCAISMVHRVYTNIYFIGIAACFAIPVVLAIVYFVPNHRFTRPGWIGFAETILVSAAITAGTVLIAGGTAELSGVIRPYIVVGTLFTLYLMAIPPFSVIWIVGGLVLRYSLSRRLI